MGAERRFHVLLWLVNTLHGLDRDEFGAAVDSPPHIARPIAAKFDSGLRSVFESLHTQMSDDAWIRDTLP